MSVKMLFPQLIQPNTWLEKAWHTAQNSHSQKYIGRFAPSPSGSLHQGSLIAAMASYLHAKWHRGDWLVRMEDIDLTRCTREIGLDQLHTLREMGFKFAEPVIWQSERTLAYREAFDRLIAAKAVYPCSCTRQTFVRQNIQCQKGQMTGTLRSWRFRFENDDFVVHHPPNEWTYQLAVVVDDAWQNITHVVRGTDLLEATPKQIALQQALGYARPIYNHVPLLLNPQGTKLSKSEQAPALSSFDSLDSLQHAWQFLGGRAFVSTSIKDFWQQALMLGG